MKAGYHSCFSLSADQDLSRSTESDLPRESRKCSMLLSNTMSGLGSRNDLSVRLLRLARICMKARLDTGELLLLFRW